MPYNWPLVRCAREPHVLTGRAPRHCGRSQADETRRILNHRVDSYASPWMGRQLFRFFKELGLREVSATPLGVVITDYGKADEMWSMEKFATGAQQAGVASAEEVERWLGYLRKAGGDGTLFTAALGFNVVGTKA